MSTNRSDAVYDFPVPSPMIVSVWLVAHDPRYGHQIWYLTPVWLDIFRYKRSDITSRVVAVYSTFGSLCTGTPEAEFRKQR